MKLFHAALLTAVLFVPAAGADDKPSTEAKGTLTLSGKTYKMASALAYENTVRNRKETVVILSEKPLDVDKLKASFKKNGNDDDFYPFDVHVKLTFDGSGELQQLSVHAAGANIIRSGDPNIKATATIKDGVAKGASGTAKPDKFRDLPFEFEIAFDVKLTKP